jgi:hypothetical protein
MFVLVGEANARRAVGNLVGLIQEKHGGQNK